MIEGPKHTLDTVSIAAPCPMKWDEMEGSDRVRFCSGCQLNVYNISEMTRKEARSFLETQTGNVCLRLYRRQDGTLITRDCPLGRRIAQGVTRAARTVAAVVITIVNATAAFAQGTDADKKPLLKLPEEIGRVEAPRDTNGSWASPAVLDFVHRVDHHEQASPQLPGGETRPTTVKPFEDTRTSRGEEVLKADTTVIDNFSQARSLERTDITRAKIYYEKALENLRKNRAKHDSKFVQQLVSRYCSFLRKSGNSTEALDLEREFGLTGGGDTPMLDMDKSRP